MLGVAIILVLLFAYGSSLSRSLPKTRGLLPVSSDRIWLIYDREIWVMNAAGQRLAIKRADEFGIDGRILNATLTPQGKVLIGSAGAAELIPVSPGDYSVDEPITLQWPADTAIAYFRSPLHLAVDAQNNILVSTWLADTAWLFAPDGEFLASIAPEPGVNISGIFSSAEGWWTTDTYNAKLRLLDAQTLASVQTIDPSVLSLQGVYRTFGALLLSQGNPRDDGALPIATTAWYGFAQMSGQVVDIFANGSIKEYPTQRLKNVGAFAWFKGELLVVDDKTPRIARYDAARRQITDFGDVELRADFENIRQQRYPWTYFSGPAPLVLIILLLAGYLTLRWYSKSLPAPQKDRGLPYRIGTPDIGDDRLFYRFQMRMARPVLVGGAGIFFVFLLQLALNFGGEMWLRENLGGPAVHTLEGTVMLLYIVMILIIVALSLPNALWARKRLRDPQYEGILNRDGLRWLTDSRDWEKVRQSGEQPRESTIFRIGLMPYWLLITNQRVLLFQVTATKRLLKKKWPLNAMVWAKFTAPSTLKIKLANDSLTGICASGVTAERIASLLTLKQRSS